ncbi:MAG: type IIL restriction-modification enzyme MmeI, partial [Blastopirellula sp. JB062]
MTANEFIARWKGSAGAELANSQSFLVELCQLLDVPCPDPTIADEDQNTYTFEKKVTFHNGDGTTSNGRVDLYRQSCFVLESKQGSERRDAEQAEALATVTKAKQKKARQGTAKRGTSAWQLAMRKARNQAERYAKALPEWPPFLIVTDVGHCFDLYADFSGSGKLYLPFPDPQSFRVPLERLA